MKFIVKAIKSIPEVSLITSWSFNSITIKILEQLHIKFLKFLILNKIIY